MWVVIRSGENWILDQDTSCIGANSYDEAYDIMMTDMANEQDRQGGPDDEFTANYDEGCGFAGMYRYVIREVTSTL